MSATTPGGRGTRRPNVPSVRPNIFLTGFMGTGKTTIGAALAERLNLGFIDTDALVEASAGKEVHQIFDEDREARFRVLEREAVVAATRCRNVVVALGGGALMDPDSASTVRASGHIVHLTARPEEIEKRTRRSLYARPLLSNGSGRAADGLQARRRRVDLIRKMLAERSESYSQADVEIATDGLDVQRCAELVAERLGLTPRPRIEDRGGVQRVPVEVREPYEVFVSSNGFEIAAAETAKLSPTSAFVLTNPLVRVLYGEALRRPLAARGIDPTFLVVPDGETHKSLQEAQRLYAELARAGADRGSLLLTLGGGVVEDLGGFVASTYMRGIALAHVPTTLLAQVDASIGGKTAVNHPLAKNMVGTFYQPRFVISNVDVVATLPDEELAEGMAEAVKTALIADAGLLDLIESSADEILSRDPSTLVKIIERCARAKARIVAEDEREAGARMWLNLGHTLGHALEAAERYEKLSHGEAVSIGMAAAARMAAGRGTFPLREVYRLERILSGLGLPVVHERLEDPALAKATLSALLLDKKGRGRSLQLVLPSMPGTPPAVEPFDLEALERELLPAAHPSTVTRSAGSGEAGCRD